jgi:hypothetical protein
LNNKFSAIKLGEKNMNWRGSPDWKDKLFGALVYLFPLFSLYFQSPFGSYLLNQFAFLNFIAIPLFPLAIIYKLLASLPLIGNFAGLIIFIILFAAVVRNPDISHFIRYNAMQAILIDILLSLLGLVLSFILNTIFLGTLVACIFGIIQSIMGKYAEIPLISEAAYSQVP